MAALEPIDHFPANDRIILREVTADDFELVRSASTDPLIPLITSVPSPWTDAEGRAYLDRQVGRRVEGVGWSLTIEDAVTHDPVGGLYINLLSRAVGAAEIGYWIGPDHRGHGYAASALALVRDWAPAQFGLDRLTLWIDPENTPSLRTAANTGFEPEVQFDAYERVGDDYRPMIRHGFGTGNGDLSTVARLEHRRWDMGEPGDNRWYEHHLHDDFVEYCSLGDRYDRAAFIANDPGQGEIEFPLSDLLVELIDGDTALVTYRSVQPGRVANRSSVWVRSHERPGVESWQWRFHQGTLVSDPN